MQGRVLIVAGSDSGGGAGIQADIKAVTAMGGYAATAITALTAQNTEGVFGVIDVPPEFVATQIRVVLKDIGADAVKTGMLVNQAVIESIASTLIEMAPTLPLVVDPVLVAKGGQPLLDPAAHKALKDRLIPLATLFTPNIPEAEALTGRAIAGLDHMERAARSLLALGAKAVLIKGGHMAGSEVTDVLVTPAAIKTFTARRIESRNTHGTGCTLASAIATRLAQGWGLNQAVSDGIEYVRKAIETAPGYGHGSGPLNHGHSIPPFTP
jgi:hydroxymethylpyrimidine/phosphomethylpyrimidine kinase